MQVSVPPYTVSCTSCTSSVAGGLHWSRDGCTFRGRVAALTVLVELSFTPTPTTSPLAPHTACGRVWFGDSRMCLPKVGVSAYFWPFLFVLSVCVCVCVCVCGCVCLCVCLCLCLHLLTRLTKPLFFLTGCVVRCLCPTSSLSGRGRMLKLRGGG